MDHFLETQSTVLNPYVENLPTKKLNHFLEFSFSTPRRRHHSKERDWPNERKIYKNFKEKKNYRGRRAPEAFIFSFWTTIKLPNQQEGINNIQCLLLNKAQWNSKTGKGEIRGLGSTSATKWLFIKDKRYKCWKQEKRGLSPNHLSPKRKVSLSSPTNQWTIQRLVILVASARRFFPRSSKMTVLWVNVFMKGTKKIEGKALDSYKGWDLTGNHASSLCSLPILFF